MTDPVRVGLFLRMGDGPARWDVEGLDGLPDDGWPTEHTAARKDAVLLLARSMAQLPIPACCAYRWQAANEIEETLRQLWPTLAFEVVHTHGAPIAYGPDGSRTPTTHLYARHRRPMRAAEMRWYRRHLTRAGRRNAIREARYRASCGYRATPDDFHWRKVWRYSRPLYVCNPDDGGDW